MAAATHEMGRESGGSSVQLPGDVRNVLEQVASSEVTVKSQQRGEPDLTADEKIAILQEILDKSPATFLCRFGKVLSANNLRYFDAFKGNYEVEYRLKELRKIMSMQARHTDVKNRRYACLQNLIQNTQYFSDEEMQSRDPLLYEQYVGQYLTDAEKEEKDLSNIQSMDKLSLKLLYQWDIQQNKQLLRMQKDQEEEMEEEEEESSDEDEDEDDNEIKEEKTESELSMSEEPKPTDDAESTDATWTPSEEERNMLHNEFKLIMQQRFLSGEDEDFDYSQVDYSEEYDNLDLRTQDEEEAYFDQEEPVDITDDT